MLQSWLGCFNIPRQISLCMPLRSSRKMRGLRIFPYMDPNHQLLKPLNISTELLLLKICCLLLPFISPLMTSFLALILFWYPHGYTRWGIKSLSYFSLIQLWFSSILLLTCLKPFLKATLKLFKLWEAMLSIRLEYQIVNSYSIRKSTSEVWQQAFGQGNALKCTEHMCGNQLLTQIQSSYDCSCQGDFGRRWQPSYDTYIHQSKTQFIEAICILLAPVLTTRYSDQKCHLELLM